MSNDSEKDLKEKVILGVAQALAIHHVARKFGIDTKLAENWFIHHRDLGCQNSYKSTGLEIENRDSYRLFINKIVDDNPDISMGKVAELLCNEMLTPVPLKGKFVKEVHVQGKYTAKSEARNSTKSGM